MASKDSSLAIRIGIFFTIALILVFALSFQVTKGTFFSNQYEVVANFRQISGVEQGTRVTLRGVPVGVVRSIDWDASVNRVRVILQIDEKYEIPRNAVAKIEVSSLLGGSVVNIAVEEGPDVIAYLAHGDEIKTVETSSISEILATVGELSSDTENLINSLNKNQDEVLGAIKSVVDDNRGELDKMLSSFAELGPKLETLADRLDRMTSGMESGEGTIGALYADKELYNQLKDVAEAGQDVTRQLKSGEGTLGNLIYKDDVVNDLRSIMEDLQGAAREVEGAVSDNREQLRSLITSLEESGPKIEDAINNFNQVAEKVNSGDGTLGRLVNDPSLYEDAQRAVNQVGESFESSEEQGVFRSFLGLVFGALI